MKVRSIMCFLMYGQQKPKLIQKKAPRGRRGEADALANVEFCRRTRVLK